MLVGNVVEHTSGGSHPATPLRNHQQGPPSRAGIPSQEPNLRLVLPSNAPQMVSEVKFGVLGTDDIRRLSVLPCRYDVNRHERDFGPNDPRLGVSEWDTKCRTCGLKYDDCVGHPGHIDLELPVFHVGYFTVVLRICRTICKTCARVMLTPQEKAYYTARAQSGQVDLLQLSKAIQEAAYKNRVCAHCHGMNGVVKRFNPLRIIHEKYAKIRPSDEVTDASESFRQNMSTACRLNPEVEKHLDQAQEFLDPLRVRTLLEGIPPEDVCLLGMPAGSKPADLIMSALLVTPACTRPSGKSQGVIRMDDLTMQYADILSNSFLDGSHDAVKYAEGWDMLQMRAAQLLDAALPGFPKAMCQENVKGFAQRLKGKKGRFRGNLSGKRVNFSGRSVISPDPNLAIDEVAIPLPVARKLTYPQRVFAHNIELMRRLVRNGKDIHPGAVAVYFTKEESKKMLFHDREALAAKLTVGDIVERHVMNGDVILFNRQPSLHRLSMMAHKARVLPYRTFRFNECCCAPYNADFDGDEMNIHLVQTEEARAEAFTLMLTANNIITAKNGEPIVACTQDFLTASYLVTGRDIFLDRAQFTQCVSHWLGGDAMESSFQLPIPALLKPVELWTGKQLFEVIICPNRKEEPEKSVRLLDLQAAAKFYLGYNTTTTREYRHDCPKEGYVAFLGSRLVSGRLDKKLLGGGAKDGLFARLYATSGGRHAATCMGRIAKFTSRYLSNYGFSLGLGDVFPTEKLSHQRAAVLQDAFLRCNDLIEAARSGKMNPLPGRTIHETLEVHLNQILSKVRDECGKAAIAMLTPSNAPLIMAESGSKGSALNIAQMMVCVGQQTVRGKRIQNAFTDRSIPHFPRFAESPDARGFVANSFFTGLTPTEFFFHTMAGREGLVDTAVKTADTGYIYRRLMKALENVSIKYDLTVRTSKNDIVQFSFGEDKLDPQLMEGTQGTPLNLPVEWLRLVREYSSQQTVKENSLPPSKIVPFVQHTITKMQASKEMRNTSEKFRQDLIKFFEGKTREQQGIRQTLGLPEEESADTTRERAQSEMLPLSPSILTAFLRRCAFKYNTKICEPGTACGAIAAQSIGEPSTQMTLRTFHFAGVASMSITQGVPRLTEIINANRLIATPIVVAPLLPENREHTLHTLRGHLERIELREIAKEMVEVVTPTRTFLQIRLNRRLINNLELPVDTMVVRRGIYAAASKITSPFKDLVKKDLVEVMSPNVLNVYPFESEGKNLLFTLRRLLVFLPEVVVCGSPGINRSVISHEKDKITAEGCELRHVMNLEGVDGERTTSNHVAVVEQVLGIEAARSCIISEIQGIMSDFSLSIDIRHVGLLADVMTCRGATLGITVYGINKMSTGVMTMASFERTTEHLYKAAVQQLGDKNLSVSENVIVGNPVPLGTNSFKLLQAPGSIGRTAAERFPSTFGSMPVNGNCPSQLSMKEAMWHQTKRHIPFSARDAYGVLGRPLSTEGTFHVDL